MKLKYDDLNIDLILGDCLEKMKEIPDGSIDMVLCDPPYGVTACKWDTVIPLEPLWKEYERIIKDNGAIILFGTEPFSSTLRMSNKRMYRYDWIWEKGAATNHLNARKMPLRKHENISVFYKKLPTYNPQMTSGKPYKHKMTYDKIIKTYGQDVVVKRDVSNEDGRRYPVSIIKFQSNYIFGSNEERSKRCLIPTQKPVLLLEYLIKTYTNPGELVLDNCMGSGSTGVACINTGRYFIGIEKDEEIFGTAQGRIEKHIEELRNNETA